MERVAPTLVHDNAVMGDGTVPPAIAARVTIPALVLDGALSPEFKHAAADAIAAALPDARRETIADQATVVPPDVLAPVLARFFA
jgi:hypothetical protein